MAPKQHFVHLEEPFYTKHIDDYEEIADENLENAEINYFEDSDSECGDENSNRYVYYYDKDFLLFEVKLKDFFVIERSNKFDYNPQVPCTMHKNCTGFRPNLAHPYDGRGLQLLPDAFTQRGAVIKGMVQYALEHDMLDLAICALCYDPKDYEYFYYIYNRMHFFVVMYENGQQCQEIYKTLHFPSYITTFKNALICKALGDNGKRPVNEKIVRTLCQFDGGVKENEDPDFWKLRQIDLANYKKLML
ncbi:hypothetical protein [Palpita vitrealis nucleopolyhedrovirus]|uniref:Uncharacterized protein n=1 Tax=Palpita vitrealis nucleopolyhedrovirus TaxID=2951960 RepID=A0AAE9RYY0_9ABAC|nr:hypothetical protein [Palpita vitrealis nucleopolyhedrovirus]